MKKNLQQHDSAATQAAALAENLAGRLNDAITARGQASIAFSGGSTPAAMLESLARQPVDWARVTVTLVDERCVAATDARANAGMLQAKLLSRLTVQPTFVPLFVPGESEAERDARLQQVPLPFDIVHLGMGEDAHTASFFPDAPNIAEMLDLQQPRLWLTTQSSSSREERITWSLATLLQARYYVLQITGAAKHAVLADALDNLDAGVRDEAQRRKTPVLAFLAETHSYAPGGPPGHIYYASE